VLPDLADTVEAVILEELDRRAEQEAPLCLATDGHLGDSLDQPAAAMGDLVERAFQRRPRDALTPVLWMSRAAGLCTALPVLPRSA